MSIPIPERFRLTNHTYDREYLVITTNMTESGKWETCVFCNDPVTDIRDFEALVDQMVYDSQDQAKRMHTEMLYKWNTIELGNTYFGYASF